MRVLVFNIGSSSLKFGVFDPGLADGRLFKGEFTGFDASGCTLHYRCGGESGRAQSRREAPQDVRTAIALIPKLLAEFGYDEFQAIGHRVVHGGERFRSATVIDADVISAIEDCAALAPLHNALALEAIRA